MKGHRCIEMWEKSRPFEDSVRSKMNLSSMASMPSSSSGFSASTSTMNLFPHSQELRDSLPDRYECVWIYCGPPGEYDHLSVANSRKTRLLSVAPGSTKALVWFHKQEISVDWDQWQTMVAELELMEEFQNTEEGSTMDPVLLKRKTELYFTSLDHNSPIQQMEFRRVLSLSDESVALLSICEDGNVCLWRESTTLPHQAPVFDLAITIPYAKPPKSAGFLFPFDPMKQLPKRELGIVESEQCEPHLWIYVLQDDGTLQIDIVQGFRSTTTWIKVPTGMKDRVSDFCYYRMDSVLASPEDFVCYSLLENGAVMSWNVEPLSKTPVVHRNSLFTGHVSPIVEILPHPIHELLITRDSDNKIAIWRTHHSTYLTPTRILVPLDTMKSEGSISSITWSRSVDNLFFMSTDSGIFGYYVHENRISQGMVISQSVNLGPFVCVRCVDGGEDNTDRLLGFNIRNEIIEWKAHGNGFSVESEVKNTRQIVLKEGERVTTCVDVFRGDLLIGTSCGRIFHGNSPIFALKDENEIFCARSNGNCSRLGITTDYGLHVLDEDQGSGTFAMSHGIKARKDRIFDFEFTNDALAVHLGEEIVTYCLYRSDVTLSCARPFFQWTETSRMWTESSREGIPVTHACVAFLSDGTITSSVENDIFSYSKNRFSAKPQVLCDFRPRVVLDYMLAQKYDVVYAIFKHLDSVFQSGRKKLVVGDLPICEILKMEQEKPKPSVGTSSASSGMRSSGFGMGGFGMGGFSQFQSSSRSAAASLFDDDATVSGGDANGDDMFSSSYSSRFTSGSSSGMTSTSATKGTTTDFAVLDSVAHFLSIERLEAFTRNEQLFLLCLVEIFKDIQANPNKLDECAIRYFVHYQLGQFMSRHVRTLEDEESLGSATVMSWREALFAYKSDTQDSLLQAIQNSPKRKLTWEFVRDTGISFWFKNPMDLKRLCEQLAKDLFVKNRDPNDCALFYLALGKRATLAGLFKAVKNQKFAEFFSNNFSEDRWKHAAMKNAFALLGKHRYDLAAAFFLLAGSLRDTIQLIMKNTNDAHLALFLCRVCDHDDAETLRQEVLKEVLASNDDNVWSAAQCQMLLGDHESAVSTLLAGRRHVDYPALYSMLAGYCHCPSAQSLLLRSARFFTDLGSPLMALEYIRKASRNGVPGTRDLSYEVALRLLQECLSSLGSQFVEKQLIENIVLCLEDMYGVDRDWLFRKVENSLKRTGKWHSLILLYLCFPYRQEEHLQQMMEDEVEDFCVSIAGLPFLLCPTTTQHRSEPEMEDLYDRLQWFERSIELILKNGVHLSAQQSHEVYLAMLVLFYVYADARDDFIGMVMVVHRLKEFLEDGSMIDPLHIFTRQMTVDRGDIGVGKGEKSVEELSGLLVAHWLRSMVCAIISQEFEKYCKGAPRSHFLEVVSASLHAYLKSFAQNIALQMAEHEFLLEVFRSCAVLKYADPESRARRKKGFVSLGAFLDVDEGRMSSSSHDIDKVIRESMSIDGILTSAKVQRKDVEYAFKAITKMSGAQDFSYQVLTVYRTATGRPSRDSHVELSNFKDMVWAICLHRTTHIAVASRKGIRDVNIAYSLHHRKRSPSLSKLLDDEKPTWKQCFQPMDKSVSGAEMASTVPQYSSSIGSSPHKTPPKDRHVSPSVVTPGPGSGSKSESGSSTGFSDPSLSPKKTDLYLLRSPLSWRSISESKAESSSNFSLFDMCWKGRRRVGSEKVESSPVSLLLERPSYAFPLRWIPDESVSSVDHEIYVQCLATHPFLPFYISGNDEGKVHLWKFGLEKCIREFVSKGEGISSVHFGPSGYKFGCTDRAGYLSLWQFDPAPDSLSPFLTIHAHATRANDFCFMGCSTLIATGGAAAGAIRELTLWDMMSQPTPNVIQCSFEPVRLIYSPFSGRDEILCGGKKGEVAVFDVRKNAFRQVWTPHTGPVHGLSLSPVGGKFFCSGGGDGDVRVWDSETLELLDHFEGAHGKRSVVNLKGSKHMKTFGITDLVVGSTFLDTCGADGRVVRRPFVV
eukprot:TRINITY_DN4341_c0_g1_i1.p1 TRINITY_DN4341_c0_g1~~TRINITY_DN4341_c0_g1_i1.p1  ORF type:complete len:2167 (-),score=543.64 TRINITY_DN4341_c0_g1_i1:1575-7592(-)